MRDIPLGTFEELVLLAIGVLAENAYSISVKNLLAESTGRSPSIGALHTALNRLEKKGFITSHDSEATAERGGRRKRMYTITAIGKQVLVEANTLRDSLLYQIPDLQL